MGRRHSFPLSILLLAIVALLWPSSGFACEYCASSSDVCTSYQDVCTSYQDQCTSYQEQCSSYSDECTSYSDVCTATDDYGNCLSYTSECDGYTQVCNGYHDVCVASKQVCVATTSECTAYRTQCNSYYYGDYVTTMGTVSNSFTGLGLNHANVTISNPFSNSVSTNTDTNGRYSTSNFVYDDAAGYLTETVCAQLTPQDRKCAQSISVFDTCSSPTLTQNFVLNITELAAPNNGKTTNVTASQITASWSPNGSLNSGYYLSWSSQRWPNGCLGENQINANYSTQTFSNLAANHVYYFAVCSHDDYGNISLPAYIYGRTLVAGPASVVDHSSDSNDSLNWQAVAGASSYNVYRSTSPGGEGGVPYKTGITSTSYNDTSVSDGTIYYYQISAVISGVETGLSQEVIGTPLAPPGIPGNLSAVPSNAQVVLGWTAPARAASYNVWRGTSAGGEVFLTNVTGNAFTDKTVVNGTTYYFEVIAINANGTTGDVSAEVKARPAVPPNAPTKLTVSNVLTTSLTTGWTSSAGTTIGFIANIRSGNVATLTCTGGTDEAAANTANFSALTPATTYTVAVCAYDIGGVQSTSLVGTVTTATPPPAPTNLGAVGSNKYVGLVWTGATGAVSYNIYRATTKGAEVLYQSGVSTLSYGDSTAINDTPYYYQVTTVNAVGESSRSLEVSAIPTASVVALADSGFEQPVLGNSKYLYNITGTPWTFTGGTGITANNSAWQTTAPEGVQTAFIQGTGAISQVASIAGGSYIVSLLGANRTGQPLQAFTFSVDGLSYGTVAPTSTAFKTIASTLFTVAAGPHTIAITGATASGNGFIDSVQLIPQIVTIPVAPANFVATAGNGQVALSWTVSPGTITYSVLRSTTSGTEATYTSGITAASYTDKAATNGTTYFYKVVAINSAGTSTPSSEVSATPSLPPPPVPTNLTATGGNAQVLLSWTASTGATSYSIYRSTSSGSEVLITSGVTSAYYTDPALTNGTKYFYQVTAANTASTSAKTAEVSATANIASIPLVDSGFELPVLGNKNYQYNITGTPWTFAGGTGITSNNSAWQTTAPEGVQVAFIQGTGSISQVLPIPAGSYKITVLGANRTGQPVQAFTFSVDGTTLGTVAPTSTAFTTFSSTLFTAAPGLHTVAVTGATASGNGFIDSVQLIPQIVTIPVAPTNLVAAAGNGQVGLSWTASVGAITYNVLRSTSSGAEATYQSGITSASYTDKAVTNGTTYYYEVVAINSAGTSTPSGEVLAMPSLPPPPVPTNVAATGGDAQVLLSWTASTGATSYSIYRSTSSGLEVLTKSGVTTTTYTDTSLTNGTKYFYQITAANSASASAKTTEVSATANLAPIVLVDSGFEQPVLGNKNYRYNVTGTQWTFTGGTGITANNSAWQTTAPEGVQVAFIQGTGSISQVMPIPAGSYKIAVLGANRTGQPVQAFTFSVDGTALGTVAPTSTAYTTFSSALFTVAAGPHTVAVTGATASGNGFIDSVQLLPQIVTIPVAPTNFVATAGNGQVGLSWTASAGAISYNVMRSTSSGAEVTYQSGINSASYTDKAATNGTTYYYEVVAVNSAGTSTLSSEASATPLLPPPLVPSNLIATGGNAQVLLTWTASTGAASYSIYRSTSSGSETLTKTGVTTSFYTDNSLTNGTKYFYQVTAVNSTSASAKTAEVSATASNAPILLVDSGFEQPVLGNKNYLYNITGTPWTFAGGTGITSNNSAWQTTAPEGVQVAFIQGTGAISQVLPIPAGSYKIAVSGANRTGQPAQAFTFSIDGTPQGTVAPTTTAYKTLSSTVFTVGAGIHTIAITGATASGNGFIDSVQLVPQ